MMAKAIIIEGKDCSPFYFQRQEQNAQEKAVQQKEKEIVQKSTYLKKFSEYFRQSNPKCKEWDDQIVSLKTEPYRFDNEESTIQTLWWAGRYIGIAHVDGCEISIRPRFGNAFLLNILEEILNIKYVNQDGTLTEMSNEWLGNLLNLVKRKMWITKCAEANRYGLPRINIKRKHQGVSLKGALDIKHTLLPWKQKQEVVTHAYEKVLDDHICKIVYEAHRILSKNVIQNKGGKKGTKDIGIQNLVGTSIPPIVQDTINALDSNYKGSYFDITEADYQRIRYKSIYQSWKPLVDLSWTIIKERELGLKASDKKTECVFIDMAEIWEAFLRKKLGEGLRDEGWRVWSAEECELNTYEHEYRSLIIPDIVLQRSMNGKEQFLVFDAKYKSMTGESYDVDRTDFFQIHTYIHYFQHAYPDGEVVLGGLLYPLTESDKPKAKGVEEIIKTHVLFGKENGRFKTKFIIDGIVCSPKSDNKDEYKKQMDENVAAMIDRIKSYIKQTTV